MIDGVYLKNTGLLRVANNLRDHAWPVVKMCFKSYNRTYAVWFQINIIGAGTLAGAKWLAREMPIRGKADESFFERFKKENQQ